MKVRFSLETDSQVESIVGKGENAGYQHFHILPKCFKRLPAQGRFKKELSA